MSTPPLKAWSYSLLNDFETCPKKYYHLRIAKDSREPESEQMMHGKMVHKALEDHAAVGTALPEHLLHLQPMMSKLLAVPGDRIIEGKVGLTRDFRPTTFFAKDVWFRGVVDFGVVGKTKAVLVDYKTGKVKDNHDQMSLFAAAGLSTYPRLTEIRTAYLWTQFGTITQQTFTDAAPIWQAFMPRVRRIEIAHETGKFPPKPSGLCRAWCPVMTCEHNGRR